MLFYGTIILYIIRKKYRREVDRLYIGKFHKYAVAGICLVGMQNDHAAHIVKVASDALIKKGFKVMIFNAFTDMFYDTPYSK